MSKYGLIGKSLGHSFSKAFFTEYFQKNNIDSTYDNIELDSIDAFVNVKNQFKGFNVTIPYKEDIIPFLDEVVDEAAEIGAVNTVVQKDGRSIGYNTDAFGFHQSIKPFFSNKHERALILGTGGASKAVAYVLEKLGVNVIYLSRNPKNSNEFAYEEANEMMLSACKMIVNCTPVGTSPDIDSSPLESLEGVGPDHLVVDLIYNPEETALLKSAKEKSAMTLNGLDMLKAQALRSYEIWQGNV